MSRHKSLLSRRLGMESLEGRQMMAGNVLASVNSSGDLLITGDTQDNNIQVVQAMQQGAVIPGRFYVTGAPNTNTTINGQSAGQYFENVTRDIKIDLKDGLDRVKVGDGIASNHFVAPHDLVIDMGTGKDGVLIPAVTVKNNLTVNQGTGDDGFLLQDSIVGTDGGIGDVTITGGNGADYIGFASDHIHGKLNVNAGGTDNAADKVELFTVDVEGDSTINTGGGADTVNMEVADFHNHDLTINTGAGQDKVSLTLVAVDELFANLGMGSDDLTLDTCLGHKATLNGNGGKFFGLGDSDSLHVYTSSFSPGGIVRKNFAHVTIVNP